MVLALFPGSLANSSCIAAKRAVEGPSRRRSANLGAIFHSIGLQCPRVLLLRELSLLSFFCPDVSFLWPASVSLSGILMCYRENYCWKCSLDIKNPLCSFKKGGKTLSSRRRNAISCKTSMRWRNRIYYCVPWSFCVFGLLQHIGKYLTALFSFLARTNPLEPHTDD